MVRGGISETIRDGLTQSSDTTNCTGGDDGLTIREWDDALSYVADGERTLMVAFEVGVSQTNKSLRAAISWCVCALHCRLGIAMHIYESERGERPKARYFASKCQDRRWRGNRGHDTCREGERIYLGTTWWLSQARRKAHKRASSHLLSLVSFVFALSILLCFVVQLVIQYTLFVFIIRS
ncbi:hypothetical protein V1505DRAFT_120084 [Lipomyces doorenjongii]